MMLRTKQTTKTAISILPSSSATPPSDWCACCRRQQRIEMIADALLRHGTLTGMDIEAFTDPRSPNSLIKSAAICSFESSSAMSSGIAAA
jgi:hypothetical protein